MVSIELLWKKGPVPAASTSGGVLNVLLPGLPNPSSSGIFSPVSLAGWSCRCATAVLKLALPRLPPPKFALAPAFAWHRLHLPSRLSRKISWPRFATLPLSGSGNARSCCRPRDSVNASSASSSSAVGSRKSTPATRFNVLVKCWMTAPVAKDLSVPSPGAPSPDQPVRGPCLLLTEVRIASTCGTPRMTNLFSRSSKPSRFSRIRPNWRISFGFSKFFLSSALVSATNSGLSGGSVAIKAASSVKSFSAGWHVPQVRPLPPNVSLKKISRPLATLSTGAGGGVLQAERTDRPAASAQITGADATLPLPGLRSCAAIRASTLLDASTIPGGADELRERFAPDDCGVVLRHVHRRRHCDDEVLEGLHVSQANRTSLELEKGLPRVGELRRQVKFVVRPRREPAGQRHRRRADGHRPFAPVQQVASPQVLAELAGVPRASGERLHFRGRRRPGSDEDRKNIDAEREADRCGRGVRDGQQYELLHCESPARALQHVALQQVNPPAEIGGRPATREFDSFGWLASGLLESGDRLVPPLCLWLQGKGQHEFHEPLLSITFLPSRALWDDAQRLGRCRQTGARRRPTAPRLRSPWL